MKNNKAPDIKIAALIDVMMGEIFAISEWLDVNKQIASGEDINEKKSERSRIIKTINKLNNKCYVPEDSLLIIHK